MTNFSQQNLPLVEKVMVDFIAEYTENERLKEAMLYSIHAGGKRLRPLLVLTTVAAFQKEMETQDYQVAASLEMIHTYSLIHDDLPQWMMMIYVVANQPITKCLVKRLPF